MGLQTNGSITGSKVPKPTGPIPPAVLPYRAIQFLKEDLYLLHPVSTVMHTLRSIQAACSRDGFITGRRLCFTNSYTKAEDNQKRKWRQLNISIKILSDYTLNNSAIGFCSIYLQNAQFILLPHNLSC